VGSGMLYEGNKPAGRQQTRRDDDGDDDRGESAKVVKS